MLTLMRKDLRVVAGFGWLLAWLVAPSYLVPVMTASRAGGMIFWVNVAFATAALVSVCLLEARSGADRFIHSLPVTRADVVRARYGTAIALAAVVLGIGAAAGMVRDLATAPPGAAWPRWFSPDVGLAYLVVMAVVIAIYLPCYFRWGYGRGSVAAAVLLAGLVIAGDAIGNGADSLARLAPGAGGLPRGLVVRTVVAMADTWGLAAASVIALAGAAGTLAVSAAAASRMYRRREF
jgi:hypothetical protein